MDSFHTFSPFLASLGYFVPTAHSTPALFRQGALKDVKIPKAIRPIFQS